MKDRFFPTAASVPEQDPSDWLTHTTQEDLEVLRQELRWEVDHDED